MAGGLKPNVHASFAQGIIQDAPRHLIPDDAVWDADNAIIKRSGAIARRGGLKTMQSAALQFAPYTIFHYRSQAEDNLSTVIVKGNNGAGKGYATFSPGAGPATVTIDGSGLSTGASNVTWDAFRHANFAWFFGNTAASSSGSCRLHPGRAARASTTNPTGTIVSTAGSPVLTGFTAMNDTAPGDFINLSDVGSNYLGRVLAVDSINAVVTVEPTPTVAISTATPGVNVASDFVFSGNVDGYVAYARHGCSFQNRLIIANTQMRGAGGATSKFTRNPFRLMWSPLPTESVSAGGKVMDGVYKITYGWVQYPLNYVDLPQLASIEKVIPIGQGALLILGSQGVAMLTGNLQTITASTGNIAFSIQDISTSVGCISSVSVQTTPAGVAFASREGIFVFDGSRLRNMMADRIARLWRENYATATIYGSATIGTHYLISTSAGNLLVNLVTGAWTKAGTFALAAAAVDLDDSNRVYGIRSGASSGVSNSDIIFRVDTILDPTAGIEQDYGTTSFQMSVKTKTYPEGDPASLNRFRHSQVVATVKGTGATMTVASTPGLEGEESGSTLGTISASATGPQAVRYDSQILSRALGYTFTTTGNASEAEVIEVRTETNALRRQRIT